MAESRAEAALHLAGRESNGIGQEFSGLFGMLPEKSVNQEEGKAASFSLDPVLDYRKNGGSP